MMFLVAAAVQSARGSTTPPALISNNSTSTGIRAIVEFGGSLVKPGARLDWASATSATIHRRSTLSSARRMAAIMA
jgi:hypothetical protein